jgi:hypothetical protein
VYGLNAEFKATVELYLETNGGSLDIPVPKRRDYRRALAEFRKGNPATAVSVLSADLENGLIEPTSPEHARFETCVIVLKRYIETNGA